MSAYVGPLETDLEPDDYVMFQFLEWWFEKCNHGAIELCWRDPATGGWHLIRRFGLDDINAAARFAAETNARPGCSIYFRPATVRFDTLHTTDADIVQIPGLWGDHDTAAAVDRMRAIQCLRPSAEIITGRIPAERVQSMFKLSGDPILIGEWARTLNRQVQKLYDSDPAVVNPSSLMRLPGSIAWPWKEGREVELTEWITPDGGGATWTLDALRATLPAVDAEPLPNGHASGDIGTSALLNPIRALIERVKVGPVWHDPVLRLVAMLVTRGTPPCVIESMAPELTWPKYTVQQTRAELATMIAGAQRKGFAPEQGELSDGTDAADESASAVEAEVMDVPPPEPSPTFRLLTDTDIELLPDPVFLIDGVLVQNSLAILYGPWASFKSFLALDWALCLATGRPWLDKPVVRSDVLYLAGEGAAGIKNRIAAWKQHHGITCSIPGFRALPLAVNLMDLITADKLVRSALEEQKASGFTPGLVICDTLARSMIGGDENSAKDMGIFVSHADTIRQQLGGIAFMPIHHSGKDAERGMRGSSSLPGGVDTAFRLTRKDNAMTVELFCEKQKDSEDGWKLHLQAEKLDLPPRPGSLKPRSSLVLTGVEASSISAGAHTKLSGDAAPWD
jgi:hypothetical protein